MEGKLHEIEPGRGTGPRILVVEDDASVRQLIIDALEWSHAAVCGQAESAHQAIGLVARDDFHAIICDVLLRGGRAEALFNHLEERGSHLSRRIVFTTGLLQVPRIEKICLETSNVLLRKPFTLEELSHALSKVLSPVTNDQ